MATRRSFLTTLSTGVASLSLSGVARAWGRRRRCQAVVCAPVVCTPLEGAAAESGILGQAQHGPMNGDWCCCQSLQQIGNQYCYSAIDCTMSGKAFGFQLNTNPYSTTSGCPSPPSGSGACFQWPPAGSGAIRRYTSDAALHIVPDSVRRGGLATAFDPHKPLPASVHEVNTAETYEGIIRGTTYGDIPVHLRLLSMAVYPDGGKGYIKTAIGQETRTAPAKAESWTAFFQDRFYIRLFDVHGRDWHVLLAKRP